MCIPITNILLWAEYQHEIEMMHITKVVAGATNRLFFRTGYNDFMIRHQTKTLFAYLQYNKILHNFLHIGLLTVAHHASEMQDSSRSSRRGLCLCTLVSLGDKSSDTLKQRLTHNSVRDVRTVCVCVLSERTECCTPEMPSANIRRTAMPPIFTTHLYQHLLRSTHMLTWPVTQVIQCYSVQLKEKECLSQPSHPNMEIQNQFATVQKSKSFNQSYTMWPT